MKKGGRGEGGGGEGGGRLMVWFARAEGFRRMGRGAWGQGVG